MCELISKSARCHLGGNHSENALWTFVRNVSANTGSSHPNLTPVVSVCSETRFNFHGFKNVSLKSQSPAQQYVGQFKLF